DPGHRARPHHPGAGRECRPKGVAAPDPRFVLPAAPHRDAGRRSRESGLNRSLIIRGQSTGLPQSEKETLYLMRNLVKILTAAALAGTAPMAALAQDMPGEG